MIRLFEKMFGTSFWSNAAFAVTRWHFDARSERNRAERGETEDGWREEWNKHFQQLFDMPVKRQLKGEAVWGL